MNRILLCLISCGMLLVSQALGQSQPCPPNINFSSGTLRNWSASTGLVGKSTTDYPFPNTMTSIIPEYTISNSGIVVNSFPGVDHYGKFPIIPTINGYAYGYSVQLGSTATSHDLATNERAPGGFMRSITYSISVPAGDVTVPYTMTYAYAMVLENGTHNSINQPLFRATLKAGGNVVVCASPEYFLPTFDDAGNGNGGGSSTGATLDSAKALANGFKLSPELFLSYSGTGGGQGGSGTWLQDVWTKDWTEVTFDLAPYRGQTVTLTFESVNCSPGAHFAYAYVALRKLCDGLEISGDKVACTNGLVTYSIPALANATYTWTVPPSWQIVSGEGTSIIQVKPGSNTGRITVHQVNSCTDLKDTIDVMTSTPTIAGKLTGGDLLCAGINSSVITLDGNNGSILHWIKSTDGVSWLPFSYTENVFTARNLNETTYYAAVVQNGASCSEETTNSVLISVDAQSNAGKISPPYTDICLGNVAMPVLEVTGTVGNLINWQHSYNGSDWDNFSPELKDLFYQPMPVSETNYYRVITKNGICAADTGAAAVINYYPVPYPMAVIFPDTSVICFGKTATLSANVSAGTGYTWSNSGVVSSVTTNYLSGSSFVMRAIASPASTTDVVLSVFNEGCPVVFKDTFHIKVLAPVLVNAGKDTAVVIGQPMQFYATTDAAESSQFSWSPATGLNNARIPNPVGLYNVSSPDVITYLVTVETTDGCIGTDAITVKVFKTPATIFIPDAFTPNKDGLNDDLKPILVGIQQLNFFRVYNRWGELIFDTNRVNGGWNGSYKGIPQASGNYVYNVQAIDYAGKIVNQKGTVMLIR
ncbi:T9SS type B sorting domain-containing protein [Polluticaenibacter yanchengensis]|uniref:Gliding motility-associated C-terminal domain-containing protein n=1 Tax=Polluticaenibacter yanchengensis TaxID=3014562 RepID=A0ABT4UF46_9BACT|nr:gliding motility-associated C-terminal domain-containing protein [Chitinophagaceae bacterium LY-5]